MSSREPSSAGPAGPGPASDVSENNAGTTKASIRGALAAHVQSLGWEEREFSDVTVTALGKVSRQDVFEAPQPSVEPGTSRPRETSNNAPKPQSQQEYPLHRLVLSRSPYFSVLMRGPWKDATSPTLTLEIQDPLVDEAAVEVALGFLYEKVPEELTPELATRTLAAASFLDPAGPVRVVRGRHRERHQDGDAVRVREADDVKSVQDGSRRPRRARPRQKRQAGITLTASTVTR